MELAERARVRVCSLMEISEDHDTPLLLDWAKREFRVTDLESQSTGSRTMARGMNDAQIL